jgi:N4-gp56 family major capsid protein
MSLYSPENPYGGVKYGTGSNSSVGTQIRTDFYKKKALIEAAKDMVFGQLADVTTMPKNFGKTIKCYHYLPLLDDSNLNDQGIDADGATTNYKVTFEFTYVGTPYATYSALPAVDKTNAFANMLIASKGTNGNLSHYLIGEGNSAANAVTAAKVQATVTAFVENITQGEYTWDTNFATTINNLQAAGWWITTDAESDHGYGVMDASAAKLDGGNLYGSSKDVGTIQGKLPLLSETGGRVNRVGFKRISLEGTIEKFGFFDEYTQESLDFDTDEELLMHINREMVRGANEITEDLIQIDLLNSAGVLRFGGDATATADLTGETGSTISVLTYEDLMRLSIDLDENRCPKHTTIITGSRMIDTRTIDSCRVLYIGNELVPMMKRMEDLFGNQAFIPVQQYADAGNTVMGEIGSIDNFRIVVVREMMHWEAAGATVTTNAGYRTGIDSGTEKYNVYPALCVGDGSFTTVGFQTDGKTVKFVITHKKPGEQTADRNDPYGEIGFMSIKWYYGFMLLRPERIALAKCVAEW